jgi:chloride channel 6
MAEDESFLAQQEGAFVEPRYRSISPSSSSSSSPPLWASQLRYPSSLDFERVVNQYSIQVTRSRAFGSVRSGEASNGTTTPNLTPGTYRTLDETKPPDSLPHPPPPLESFHRKPKRRRRGTKRLLGYTGRTATRWVLTIATGLFTGLCSIFLVHCTELVRVGRAKLLSFLWRRNNPTISLFLVFAALNMSLALLSAFLCLKLAPEAVGSGIPEVKAFLNGVRVKRFSSLRLFVVKIVATILSVSSGLFLGPEGPLVHIGAILGASCTKLSNILFRIVPTRWLANSRLLSFLVMDLSHFSTDAERRDLVSIGAGAGFAAAFGAPIGGLLFSMEEASSYLSHEMFLKTLTATAIATFCLAVYHGDLSNYSIISLGVFQTTNRNIFLNRVEEFPLYIIVAIAGGILGGVFCRVWKAVQLFKRRFYPTGPAQLSWKLAEVACLSLLTSLLMYYVPTMTWACRPIDMYDNTMVEANKLLDPFKNHASQFHCPTGEINELGTIFFGSREAAISSILTDPRQFQLRTLLIVGLVFFPLMTLTLGVSLPSGIFMPTFLIGTSLGGAAGMIFQEWMGEVLPTPTFALLGAAALLTGVQRSTVSLCVILVEGTGQVKVLIPVIVTVVIARYVADLISTHGLYEIAIEINHYPFLEHEQNKVLDIFEACEIMSAPVVTVGPSERTQDLVKLLRVCEHHGFPVVDPESKTFLGLVRRDQIIALLECEVFEDRDPSVDFDATSFRSQEEVDYGIEKSPLMHLAYHIKGTLFLCRM